MKDTAIKFLFLLCASGGAAVCAFMIQVILARLLTPYEYGSFASALAIITLLSSLAGVGVPGFLVRAFGAEGLSARRWLRVSYSLSLWGICCCILLLLLWSVFGPHDKLALLLLALLAPIIVSQIFVELVTVKFQLEGRFFWLACWQLFPNLLRLLGIAGVIVFSHLVLSIHIVGIIYAITAFSLITIGLYLIRQLPDFTKFLGTGHTSSSFIEGDISVRTVLHHATPFALSGVFYIVYFQSDVIFLNYLSGSEAAGLYNVAFTIMVAVYLIPNTLYQKLLLPSLFKWNYHERDKLSHVYREGISIMGVGGILLMACLLVLMPITIPWLFGSAYHETINILNILLFCIPLRFISSSMASVLVSEVNIKRKTAAMGYTALANIILNICFIPYWHAYGAALATLLSELLLLILFYRNVNRFVLLSSENVNA